MLALAGIVVVFAAVLGGFTLAGGNVHVLVQPAEVLIIVGAAVGAFLISSPKKVVFGVLKNLRLIFQAKETTRQDYIDILLCILEILMTARRDGLLGIESHLNNPAESRIFTRYESVLNNRELRDFICDNMKVLSSGNIDPHEFDNLMDVDVETQHGQAMVSPTAVAKVADALPGLGIVAAVLGVVLTMGKINEPPEVLGHSVGAALVGTFLGVLACYGFVGPMSINLEHQAREKQAKLNMVKTALMAFALGRAPVLAVESGRRAIPSEDRPSFEEMEEAMRDVRRSPGHTQGQA